MNNDTSDLINLSGKTAIVTGGSFGIGRGIVDRLVGAGAKVLIVDIKAPDNEAHSRHKMTRFYQVDLSNAGQINAFWRDIKDEKVDILVNNAGFYPVKDFLKSDREFDKSVFDLNLNSVIDMSRRFIARQKKKGGTIINIGSVEAIMPFKDGLVQYSISKAGVIALTRALAHSYAKYGWRSNAILPGGIQTEGTRMLGKQAIFQFKFDLLLDGFKFWQRLPNRHTGEPDDIAKVALFLASDLSSYMNGALVSVDGGFLSA